MKKLKEKASPAKRRRDSTATYVTADNGADSNGKTYTGAPGELDGRPIRIYADGIYDLFHYGHMRQLKQAKSLFPNTELVVGCCNDELTHKFKGRTVLTEDERYDSIQHCKYCDELVKNAPWVPSVEFLRAHRIDYIAHDDVPYTSAGQEDCYAAVKRAGMFKATERTDGISTSDLILRIIKDYNDFVLRNLKRGYSRKDLGVSLFKVNQIQVESEFDKLRDRFADSGVGKLSKKVKEQRLRVQSKVADRVKRTSKKLEDMVDRTDRNIKKTKRNIEEIVDRNIRAAGDKIEQVVESKIDLVKSRYEELEHDLKLSAEFFVESFQKMMARTLLPGMEGRNNLARLRPSRRR